MPLQDAQDFSATRHVYVFHHQPRTAGTSVARVLSAWFDPVWDFEKDGSERGRSQWLDGPVDLRRLAPGQVLIGHYQQQGVLERRYPSVLENDAFRLVTFLRDPYETAMSRLRSAAGRHMLEQHSPDDALLELAGSAGRDLSVPPLTLEAALARYWFVGVTEQLRASLELLAWKLGRALPAVPQLNGGAATSTPRVSAAARAEFRRRAATDYDLYRCVQERLRRERRLAGMTTSTA